MSLKFDFAINYAAGDDAKGDQKEGWVSNFHKFLELMLFQVLGRRPRILRSPKGDKLERKDLEQSAILINIMSPAFVGSKECAENLKFFLSTEDKSQEFPRVFKVVKASIDPTTIPGSLVEYLSYDFFLTDEESGTTYELMDYFSPEAEKNYWMKMVDLAYDIHESLITILDEEAVSAIKPMYSRKSVFLAQTSTDLAVQRNIIRRELQRHGYKVLPNKTLPSNSEGFEKEVKRQMKDCAISIHMIGSHYGDIPTGSDRSVIDLQNKIASDLSKSSGDEDSTLSRLIWINPDIKSVSERHKSFIENVRRDLSSLEGAEILETPLEDFKNVIREELIEGRIGKKKTIKMSDSGDSAKKVYLVYDKVDREGIAPLVKQIESDGYIVLHPEFGDELLVMRQHHIERMISCDIAMVFMDKVNEQWVRMKVLDLMKAPGFGRMRPISDKAIVAAPGVKINPDSFKGYDVEVFQADKDSIALKKVQEFLKGTLKVI